MMVWALGLGRGSCEAVNLIDQWSYSYFAGQNSLINPLDIPPASSIRISIRRSLKALNWHWNHSRSMAPLMARIAAKGGVICIRLRACSEIAPHLAETRKMYLAFTRN